MSRRYARKVVQSFWFTLVFLVLLVASILTAGPWAAVLLGLSLAGMTLCACRACYYLGRHEQAMVGDERWNLNEHK